MTIKLSAKKRETFGKSLDEARQSGLLPAVLYGAKQESLPLLVDTVSFRKVFEQAGESSIVSLETDGRNCDVLIHEVQFHPKSGAPIHADFYVVEQDKEIEVDVPLVFEGVSPAVKELGGSLIKVLHELTVEALPKNLPHDIKVDISLLATFDSQILVKDVKLPAGVKAVAEPEEVIAAVGEAGEEVSEETASVDLSAIEVEKKGKKEEETETDK